MDPRQEGLTVLHLGPVGAGKQVATDDQLRQEFAYKVHSTHSKGTVLLFQAKAFKAHSCESNILPISFLMKGHFTLHYYQSRIKSKGITMSQSTSNHSVKIYFSLNYIKLSLHKFY